MRAILLLIIGLNLMAVGAASEWEEYSASLKINWGESVNVSDYNITAIDFRPGTVEENPEKCKTETDGINRRFFGCDDYVLLSISKNGNHVQDAALAKENYTVADGAVFLNETVYEDDESSLKITAKDVVTGYKLPSPYTVLDVIVKKRKESEFDIAKNLTITRIVPGEAHVNPSFQFIPVTITVENIGNLNFSYISVKDSTGDGFVSEPQDLTWSISLERGGKWEKEYLIKPLKPTAGAEYTLPSAMLYIALYNKTYNLSTGNLSFILRSSEIILSKTADKKDAGNVTVNISLKNNGSRAALVKVWDSLPPGMESVSGELNFSIVLQPGSYYNSSYLLKINNIPDNISLPPARFVFKEYKPGYDPEGNQRAITGSGVSNPVEITFAKAAPSEVRIASTENSPTPSIENSKNTSDTPGFYESLVAELKNLPMKILKMLGFSGQTADDNPTAISGSD